MDPIRGEELIRIAIIASISALVGCATVIVLDAIYAAAGAGFWSFVASFVSFFFIFPIAAFAGLLAHLVLRSLTLPRPILLPLFVGLGYLVGQFFVSWKWLNFGPLTTSISTTAWVLYSFGPFRLWRFKFVLGEHRNF